ncbi:MAG: oligosaccharide flippase family protein [Acidimicrobiales bacterium]
MTDTRHPVGPSATGPSLALAVTGPDASPPSVAAVARGGALNLVGSIVYGVANFVLLVVLNRTLGTGPAGIVLVAIAIFNITSTVAELGCSTGLIRMISRDRAVERQDRVRATVVVGVVPVALVATVFAGVLFLTAGSIAAGLGDGANTRVVGDVLRAMAVFLPFSALHSVLISGTRGFDTMRPQVVVERIGRAVTLPLVVAVAVALGMGPVGVGAAWAATNLVALVFSSRAMATRVHGAVEASGRPPVRADAVQVRSFWAFTAPRAVGQASEVAVNWVDTVLVGALVSTTAAGIYASGTRYLLPGLYAADALMQVTGPRISGLLARGEREEASALLKVVAGWQTAVMWPLYLLTALFPTPLLQVFGPEVVRAKWALVALAVAMLVTAPAGPVASVILMSGRSGQAMVNTLALVAVNLGGNLIFVRRYGVTGAGVVWAVTILVAALLPGWQAARSLHVATLGRPAFVAAGLAGATVGVIGGIVRLAVGDDLAGLALATILGALAYLAGLSVLRVHLHLDALWSGIRRRS